MDENKAWYLSNTVWASVIQMIVGLLASTGYINDVAGTTVVSEGPGLVVGVITSALAVWGFYGRIRATKKLTA